MFNLNQNIMGDYVSKGPKAGVKIGTCGLAYYATLNSLKEYARHTNCPEVNYYLDKSTPSYFPFPYPELDNKGIGEISWFLGDPEEVELETFNLNESINHGGIYVTDYEQQPPKQAKVKCPDQDLNESSVALMSIGYFDGVLMVGLACRYCNKRTYVDAEHIGKIIDALTENFKFYQSKFSETSELIWYKRAERVTELIKRIYAIYEPIQSK